MSLWGVSVNGSTTNSMGDQFNFSIYFDYLAKQTMAGSTGWVSHNLVNLTVSNFSIQEYTGITVEIQSNKDNSGPVGVNFVLPLRLTIARIS